MRTTPDPTKIVSFYELVLKFLKARQPDAQTSQEAPVTLAVLESQAAASRALHSGLVSVQILHTCAISSHKNTPLSQLKFVLAMCHDLTATAQSASVFDSLMQPIMQCLGLEEYCICWSPTFEISVGPFGSHLFRTNPGMLIDWIDDTSGFEQIKLIRPGNNHEHFKSAFALKRKNKK